MANSEFDMLALIRSAVRDYPEGLPPAVEAELVAHALARGKARCEASTPSTFCEPVAEDLFIGTVDLPEIPASELSRDALAAGILHHGALLVREFYNPEQLQRLQQLARTQEEANRADNLPLGCSDSTLLKLLELYDECGLLEAVRGYLDDDAVIFAERTKLRHHRAQRDKFAAIPWHQDVNFFGQKSYAINCWAAVTSCGEKNPGLSLLPRRMSGRVGWNDSDGIAPLDYGKSLSESELASLSRHNPIAHPVLRPGDALLFDEMTVHQTASRRWSLEEQVVSISWFFRASNFPSWGTPLAI